MLSVFAHLGFTAYKACFETCFVYYLNVLRGGNFKIAITVTGLIK